MPYLHRAAEAVFLLSSCASMSSYRITTGCCAAAAALHVVGTTRLARVERFLVLSTQARLILQTSPCSSLGTIASITEHNACTSCDVPGTSLCEGERTDKMHEMHILKCMVMGYIAHRGSGGSTRVPSLRFATFFSFFLALRFARCRAFRDSAHSDSFSISCSSLSIVREFLWRKIATHAHVFEPLGFCHCRTCWISHEERTSSCAVWKADSDMVAEGSVLWISRLFATTAPSWAEARRHA